MFLIRDELREHLKNTPKVIVAQKPDAEPDKSSSSSSSSESSSSESDSSASVSLLLPTHRGLAGGEDQLVGPQGVPQVAAEA